MFVLTLTWAEEPTRKAEIATLISFPAIITAEIALIMTAVRLLVMYYPSHRAKWGRFTREKPLTNGLACVYISMEMVLWSATWLQDLTRCVRYFLSGLPQTFGSELETGKQPKRPKCCSICLSRELTRCEEVRTNE